MSVGLITAYDKNRLMGVNNSLPWNIKEEMDFFKNTTLGNIVIMGYNTYISLKKPLKDRVNVVLTSKKITNPNIFCFFDVEKCLNFCRTFNKQIFVIGGQKVYNYFLDNNLVDHMYISEIDTNNKYSGNCVYFPKIDEFFWEKFLIIQKDQFKVFYYKKKY